MGVVMMTEVRSTEEPSALLGWIKGLQLGPDDHGSKIQFAMLLGRGELDYLEMEVGAYTAGLDREPYLALKADRVPWWALKRVIGFIPNRAGEPWMH